MGFNPVDLAFGNMNALRSGNERLRAENAKLREEFRKMDEWHSKELSAAMAENAKLRELVLDIDAVHMSGYDCTECPFYDECETDAGCHAWIIIHDHMRRLGLEDE